MSPSLITLSCVFVAYCSFVFSIGLNCGGPSYATLAFASASARFTVTVVGICASITASDASIVPGTDASTLPFGESSGIFMKSGGSLSLRILPRAIERCRSKPPSRKQDVVPLRHVIQKKCRYPYSRHTTGESPEYAYKQESREEATARRAYCCKTPVEQLRLPWWRHEISSPHQKFSPAGSFDMSLGIVFV